MTSNQITHVECRLGEKYVRHLPPVEVARALILRERDLDLGDGIVVKQQIAIRELQIGEIYTMPAEALPRFNEFRNAADERFAW